jgi:hypothetical protein
MKYEFGLVFNLFYIILYLSIIVYIVKHRDPDIINKIGSYNYNI